jgi:hypothetical protein
MMVFPFSISGVRLYEKLEKILRHKPFLTMYSYFDLNFGLTTRVKARENVV